ncbi:MAG: hypothetical protein ABJE95_39680 [Byssovorax sp.]
MGHLDQFAKETFAQETASVTHGAATWQLPPELNMSEVRLDGLLLVTAPAALAALPPPWSTVKEPGEIILEIKMAGDHTDMVALDRAVLRRYARQVQRREDRKDAWDGEEPLWIVAPRVPPLLAKRRSLECLAPGCYLVSPTPFPFLWIAANELPLLAELVPFLIARSGNPLDEFVHWVKTRRPIDWILHVLDSLPMSNAAREDLHRYAFPKTDDPERLARRRDLINYGLEMSPEIREDLFGEARKEGHRDEARKAVRRVLKARNLAIAAADEAQLDACSDLDTLERWLDQAIVATSTTEALR